MASLWSRRLTFVGLATADGSPTLSRRCRSLGTLDLPFCPRELALVADGSKLVVADAFGGRLAVVDAKRRAIDSVRSLPAHNIRGLAFAPDGQTLVIAHQVLNRLAQTSFDDVHWGLLDSQSSAGLADRRLVERRVRRRAARSAAGCSTWATSAMRRATRPTLAFDVRGNLIVALAGVDEVAITASPDQGPRRIVVGRRPTAVVPSPDGTWSMSPTRWTTRSRSSRSPTGFGRDDLAGPATRPDRRRPGRAAVLASAKLSHDGWMSCHSCHTDGHTNNLSSDTLGDGSYGAPKRVPSLLGVAATGPWTWTGSIPRLEDQVRKSIATTMHGSKPTDGQVADLTAYLGSLAPPHRDDRATARSTRPPWRVGRAVFEGAEMRELPRPPRVHLTERYDVGLYRRGGQSRIQPSVVARREPRDTLLHDGRARSLDDVFQKERHPRGLELTPPEIADLVAFLKTL